MTHLSIARSVPFRFCISVVAAGNRGFSQPLLGGLLLLLLLVAQAHAAPKVVVSVLPVHSLVSALMRDVGDAQLLILGGQSPHASQLKPSQVDALATADLIVWVGPLLERPVGKIIAQRRGAARIVTLLENDEITLLPGRYGAEGRRHGHGEEAQTQAAHAHRADDHWRADPHVWLSFDNARAIVEIVARELVSIDPPHRDRYESNARDLLSRLAQLRQSLHEDLRGVVDAAYVVFHDAYGYFEHEFDLHPVGYLTISAERPPGAKRIRRIRQIITSRKVRCVFSEPQFQHGLVDTLVADSGVASGVLDPLGAGLKAGPDAWFELMRRLGDSLTACLGRLPE